MRELSVPKGRTSGPQFREVLDCIEGLLAEGLRHGFFNYSIRCEIGRDGRRQLIIEAGKSHKFTIPKDEVSH
jgi:hypothetical protein